jgi:hypothetical protein
MSKHGAALATFFNEKGFKTGDTIPTSIYFRNPGRRKIPGPSWQLLGSMFRRHPLGCVYYDNC